MFQISLAILKPCTDQKLFQLCLQALKKSEAKAFYVHKIKVNCLSQEIDIWNQRVHIKTNTIICYEALQTFLLRSFQLQFMKNACLQSHTDFILTMLKY